MRHWSLCAVSGETVRLDLPLTHHLEGSKTWSIARLVLNQPYIGPMMSLNHQRDPTAAARGGPYSLEQRDPLLAEVERKCNLRSGNGLTGRSGQRR